MGEWVGEKRASYLGSECFLKGKQRESGERQEAVLGAGGPRKVRPGHEPHQPEPKDLADPTEERRQGSQEQGGLEGSSVRRASHRQAGRHSRGTRASSTRRSMPGLACGLPSF